jgi:class 3 adenylate cyclase
MDLAGGEPSVVEYARSGEFSIAYRVLGRGPVDLVVVPFAISSIFASEFEPFLGFFERLASFSRLILFDKRGIGASDRPRTPPTLEAQMDDVRAVLDAVGSEQAALFGSGHGGQMCALFAATYPERTRALVLYDPWPRFPGTRDEHRRLIGRIHDESGRLEEVERSVRDSYPSLVGDQAFLRALALIMRASTSPGAYAQFMRTVVEADIGDVLPTIRVPTLVLYRKELAHSPDLWTPTGSYPGAADGSVSSAEERAREVAAAIPNAQVIVVAGRAASPFVGDEIPDEIERFVTSPLTERVSERVLATLLFTDIVGSTEQAATLGDRAWTSMLAAHRAAVRRALARFAGVELDTAGDGFFASFDGPARAITCAQEILAAAAGQGLQIRAGIHTGECEREANKLAGLAVHIGARIAAVAQPGEVLVSRTVKDLVAGSGISFDDRGEHNLKGVPGEWQLYAASVPTDVLSAA